MSIGLLSEITNSKPYNESAFVFREKVKSDELSAALKILKMDTEGPAESTITVFPETSVTNIEDETELPALSVPVTQYFIVS